MTDMEMTERIAQFIEDTRDEDGAFNFVWLPDRGVMVHLETCTSLELVNAANEWLTLELDRLNAELRRVKILKKQMETMT